MERFLLSIFPLSGIVGGWGLWGVLSRFVLVARRRLVISLTILVLFGFALLYNPYFSTYYNPLLGGRGQAEKLFRVESTGQLYPEVARWINAHEKPYDLVTVTNYGTHSLRPYILGKVFNKNETLPDGLQADFFVVPWDQTLSLRYQQCVPVHDVYFHRDLYWRIYDCKR